MGLGESGKRGGLNVLARLGGLMLGLLGVEEMVGLRDDGCGNRIFLKKDRILSCAMTAAAGGLGLEF